MTSEEHVGSEDIETTETVEDETTTDTEATTTSTEQSETVDKDRLIAELEEKNKKLYARLKRQKNSKDEKSSETEEAKADTVSEPLSRDEAILYAQGHSDEAVAKAKQIAALEGMSVRDAANSEMFSIWKEKREREVKEQKAQLAASKGSRATVKKTFATAGLSDEDHRELFNQKMGR